MRLQRLASASASRCFAHAKCPPLSFVECVAPFKCACLPERASRALWPERGCSREQRAESEVREVSCQHGQRLAGQPISAMRLSHAPATLQHSLAHRCTLDDNCQLDGPRRSASVSPLPLRACLPLHSCLFGVSAAQCSVCGLGIAAVVMRPSGNRRVRGSAHCSRRTRRLSPGRTVALALGSRPPWSLAPIHCNRCAAHSALVAAFSGRLTSAAV